jgi:hypothetical protein
MDSLKIRLENLKAGKYPCSRIERLKNNNKFDPKNEKIGFIKHFITVLTTPFTN